MGKLLTPDDSAVHWKAQFEGKLPVDWAAEIDAFETELILKKHGKIEDRIFAESRLRRGAYGQRYDNGSRNDGKTNRPIPFPSGELMKGPNTRWDAPGMLRIKIPYGGMTTVQMDMLSDLAEEYSDSICHVTTRQDIQLHYVHIDDTPSIFRRLAAVGITTREACGNSVRNVTGCPCAGVCQDEMAVNSKFLSPVAATIPALWRGCTTWALLPPSARKMASAVAGLKCMWAVAWAQCRFRHRFSPSLFPKRNCFPLPRRLPASMPAWGRRKTATGLGSSF